MGSLVQKLAHTVVEAMSHGLLSASWRTKNASVVIQSESESLGLEEVMV